MQAHWWEPYLSDEVDSLVDMTQVGARRGVTLCYAIRPEARAAPTTIVSKLHPL